MHSSCVFVCVRMNTNVYAVVFAEKSVCIRIGKMEMGFGDRDFSSLLSNTIKTVRLPDMDIYTLFAWVKNYTQQTIHIVFTFVCVCVCFCIGCTQFSTTIVSNRIWVEIMRGLFLFTAAWEKNRMWDREKEWTKRHKNRVYGPQQIAQKGDDGDSR